MASCLIATQTIFVIIISSDAFVNRRCNVAAGFRRRPLVYRFSRVIRLLKTEKFLILPLDLADAFDN